MPLFTYLASVSCLDPLQTRSPLRYLQSPVPLTPVSYMLTDSLVVHGQSLALTTRVGSFISLLVGLLKCNFPRVRFAPHIPRASTSYFAPSTPRRCFQSHRAGQLRTQPNPYPSPSVPSRFTRSRSIVFRSPLTSLFLAWQFPSRLNLLGTHEPLTPSNPSCVFRYLYVIILPSPRLGVISTMSLELDRLYSDNLYRL
jgi:hypothetical protein